VLSFLAGALVLAASATDARQDEAPIGQVGPAGGRDAIATYFIPAIPQEALLLDDEPVRPGEPHRFAEPIRTLITPETHGTWEEQADGSRVWRLRIDAPGATDLNVGFETWHVPAGTKLWVISEVREYFEGPYTEQDNAEHGELWLPVVPGSRARIEMFVPAERKFDPEVGLTHIGYGFRDWFKLEAPVLRQGACNNDVICPEGDPWREEIASVAVYQLSGFWACTGTMVMNTASDFTPYFLTANHCGVSSGNDATMVVYWNFESPACGALSGGSLADNQTGAILRAARSDVDVCLVELEEDPDPGFGVYFAGWDASGAVPSGSVGIHHPSTDEKAISFNTDGLTTQSSCIGGGTPNTHWRVNNWEDGTTEPGSSGSGLWDPDTHLLVGFLSGGLAACGNTEYDCYGKVSVAWGGASSSSRLKDWLDPGNTGATSLGGSFPDGIGSLKYAAHTGADDCEFDPGQNNGIWEPGETVVVPVMIRASGGSHTAISGNLSSSTPGVTILDGAATWPNVTSGSTATTNAPHFQIRIEDTVPCGAQLDFDVVVTSAEGGPFNLSFSEQVGQDAVPTGLPVAVPDEGLVTHTFTVAQASFITDLDVRVEIQHTWVGDLILQLESPAGTVVTLLDRPGVPASGFGCGDDDMNVLFDDASGFDPENHCPGSTPWYDGSASPVGALSAFNGESTAGDWKLHVSDNASGDTGTIVDWELITTPGLSGTCDECVSTVDSPIASLGNGDSFGLGQNRPNPFVERAEISFSLPQAGLARLEIFDVTGRLVRTLVNGPMAAGAHAASWDGRDESRQAVAAGIYFYRLSAGEETRIKRMSLIR
jgi:subtilisin-like proprotein convertase family protein